MPATLAFWFITRIIFYLKNKCNKKFSLVLDLDETLISFKLEPGDENKGTIRFRPYLDSFF